jgi:hypothetical protein
VVGNRFGTILLIEVNNTNLYRNGNGWVKVLEVSNLIKHTMKNRWVYTCFVYIIFLVGCNSGFRFLKTIQDKDFLLKNYQSFGFEDIETREGQEEVNYSDIKRLMKEQVEKRFLARGLKHTDMPELKINLTSIVDEKIQTRQTDFNTDGAPRYMGQRRFSWKSEEVEVGRYKQGTILLDLVDTKSNMIVWRSGVEGVLPKKEKKLKEDIVTEIGKLIDSIQ